MTDKTSLFLGSASASRRDPEPDAATVFKNFKGGVRAPSQGASEAEARRRHSRMTSEDRMRGVVVEVRRSRTRPVREEEEVSAIRF